MRDRSVVHYSFWGILFLNLFFSSVSPARSETPQQTDLDLKPEIVKESPVLQRWIEEIPDVADDIENDPSFRTRIRLGYSLFPSSDDESGVNVGVEDIFLGKTGLTVSGDYQASVNGDRESVGGDLQYYVLPLGSYFNFAPVAGYRYIKSDGYSTDGFNLGVKLMLALSRTGAANISLSQSFVSPGGAEEVGITTLSIGYALTKNWRISTDIQKQNSIRHKDSRVGIAIEWMP